MRKKPLLAIIALIGLSSFVVLGSSPGLIGKILESVQDNPITRAFSPESQTDLPKTNVEPSVEARKSNIPSATAEHGCQFP